MNALTVLVFFLCAFAFLMAFCVIMLIAFVVKDACAERKAQYAERQLNAAIALINTITALKEMKKDKDTAEIISAVDVLTQELHAAAEKEIDTPELPDDVENACDRTTQDIKNKYNLP